MTNKNQRREFHLVNSSPWLFISAIGALTMIFGGVLYMHGYVSGSFLYKFGIVIVIFMMYSWWRDVVREGTFESQHTLTVQKGLKLGMLLFIISEIMFFFAFFWGFFHSSFNPSIFIGAVWPPIGLIVLDTWKIPFLNTLILLTSGASVTWAHNAIILGEKKSSCSSLLITVFLAVIFTLLQYMEYITAPFHISDSVYGSTFYMTTGFHGFHVFIGTCFLTIGAIRLYFNHFTTFQHFGFEAAAWYWHFVDIVWLFLFFTIYWWGGK
jgi:cytochrome c oxidase subunit 3